MGDRDNKSLCKVILQNLIKITTEAYNLYLFEKAILVKFDFGGQNSCFDKAALLIKNKDI